MGLERWLSHLKARLITKKLMQRIVSKTEVTNMLPSLSLAILTCSLNILLMLAEGYQMLFSFINNTFAVAG